MKTRNIRRITNRTPIFWLFMLTLSLTFGQKKQGFIPPSIDDEDIPVVKTELPIPAEGEDYVVKYFKGITDGVESRIAVKKLGYILRPAMVQVFSEDGRELAIELVKKNWDDVVRSGTTENGEYTTAFRTAMEFGIKISALEKDVPFVVAVSAGIELFPSSNLFVTANTKKNIGQANVTDTDGSAEGTANLLWYVILGLAVIVVLLLVLVFKKGRNSLTILLLLLAISSSYAGRVSPLSHIGAILRDEKFQEIATDIGGNLVEALGKQYGSRNTFSGLQLLGTDDADHEPNMDPRGQPSLPSSCYNIAAISQSGSSSNSGGNAGRNGNRQQGQNAGYNTGNQSDSNSGDPLSTKGGSNQGRGTDIKPLSSSNDKIENPFTGESRPSREPRLPKYDEYGNLKDSGDYPDAPTKYDPSWSPPENPFTGESHTSREPRLPKYDENGDLKNPGDYPDAPAKYDPNWSPPENPFTGESHSSREPRLPKYDEYGNLKNPGDYPDAPIKYDPNWSPPESPFVDGPSQRGTFARMPKYDKDGRLLDAGDYPQAPKEIDPIRVNDEDYILEQIESNGQDKAPSNESLRTEPTSNSTASGNSSATNSRNNPNRSGGGNNTEGGENPDQGNEEGCACLEKAYKDLQHNRYTLEKLLKIAQHTKKVTDFGISFGDNFSGIHAVSGLAWQKERFKILKTIENFDKTYDNKYKELMDHLYGSLMKIDSCEKMLGNENWYSLSGFIYYEFMKVRYASYK